MSPRPNTAIPNAAGLAERLSVPEDGETPAFTPCHADDGAQLSALPDATVVSR